MATSKLSSYDPNKLHISIPKGVELTFDFDRQASKEARKALWKLEFKAGNVYQWNPEINQWTHCGVVTTWMEEIDESGYSKDRSNGHG